MTCTAKLIGSCSTNEAPTPVNDCSLSCLGMCLLLPGSAPSRAWECSFCCPGMLPHLFGSITSAVQECPPSGCVPPHTCLSCPSIHLTALPYVPDHTSLAPCECSSFTLECSLTRLRASSYPSGIVPALAYVYSLTCPTMLPLLLRSAPPPVKVCSVCRMPSTTIQG